MSRVQMIFVYKKSQQISKTCIIVWRGIKWQEYACGAVVKVCDKMSYGCKFEILQSLVITLFYFNGPTFILF